MSGEHSGNFFTSSWTHLHALFQVRPLSTAMRSRQHRSYQFMGYDCNNHKDHCGEGRFNPLKHPAQTSSCCAAAAHIPPARDLRLNHYQYKSVA